jgi:hypothetical protein
VALDIGAQGRSDRAHRVALERINQRFDGHRALGAGGGNDAGVIGLAAEQARVAHKARAVVELDDGRGQGRRAKHGVDTGALGGPRRDRLGDRQHGGEQECGSLHLMAIVEERSSF